MGSGRAVQAHGPNAAEQRCLHPVYLSTMLRTELKLLPTLEDLFCVAQMGSTICNATALCYGEGARIG